jgi:hypothetical protein
MNPELVNIHTFPALPQDRRAASSAHLVKEITLYQLSDEAVFLR